MITHLEPHILEGEAKWASGSISANEARGGAGTPAELLQIRKDDAVPAPHSVRQQMRETPQRPRDWTRSVFIPVPEKGGAKECSNYCTTALTSHTSKVTLKILQARLQQYWNWELPDAKDGFRKGRGTKLPTSIELYKKSREFQKNTYFFIDYAKVFVWITTNCAKFFKRWE